MAYIQNGLFGFMRRQQVNTTERAHFPWSVQRYMTICLPIICLNIMFTWIRFQFLPLCAVARVTDWQAAPNTAIMGFLKYRELYNTSVACPGSHWSKRNSTYLPHTLTQIPWLATISVLLTISAHDTWSRKEKVMSTDKMKNQRRNACFKLV